MSGNRLAHRGPALVLCFFVALAAPARGDVAASDERTPEVRLDEVVVRLPRPEPAGPGAAATVVEAERFAGEAKSVAELVATAPGVAVREHGGVGQLAVASIRGSTADGVLVLLDGLPLHTAFGGGVNLSTIPRYWISSVEVVRGVEGARFGSGALGGVLNVVTRPAGASAEPRWSSQLTGGSYGTWSAGADASAGDGRKGILLSLGWDRTSGDFWYTHDPAPSIGGDELDRTRQNAAGEGGGALVKAFADVAGGRLDALAQLSGGGHELPGYPYALTPNDRQDDLRAMGVVRFARPAWQGAVWKAQATARHDRLDTRLAALGGETVRQRGVSGALRGGLSMGAGPHALDLGAEVGGEEITAAGIGAPSLGATGLAGTRRRATLAASAADDLSLLGGRLVVGPALRLERVGDFSGWSASVGGKLGLVGPLTALASAGRTFRAPSVAELYLEQGLLSPNPALVPEEGIGGSVGIAADGRRGVARATAFTTLYRDLIVYQQVSRQRLRPVNAGKAVVHGLELEAASVPVGRLGASASAAYTLLLTENLRGEDAVVGKDLPLRPRHRLFARASVAPGPWKAHAEAQLVGRQYLDTHNLGTIPRALTFAVGASVRVARRPDLHLHLDVRNLLDDRTVQDGLGNPLPSRMVLLGLRAGSPQEGTP